MKMKKLLSGVICASMLLSSFTSVHADELTETTDNWNYSLVSESTRELYTDFPMTINKSVGKDMSMSIQFQYLKNISVNDSVTVTVTDLSTGSVVDAYQLTSNDNTIIWNDVENNKYFSVTVEENLSGIESEYTGYIATKFIPTDFPVDIKLGDTSYNYNNGEEFSSVAIKKVGVHAACNHEEDEECTAACKTASVLDVLSAVELDTFYSYLDTNCYYEMQVEASNKG